MNNSCAVSGDKVFVSNEEGTLRKIEYQDNFDNILEMENKIETLQDEQENLKKREKDKIKEKKFLKIYLTTLGVLLGAIISLCSFIGIPLVVIIPILVAYESAVIACNIGLQKLLEKEIKVLNKQFEAVKEKLEKEINCLNYAKNIKTKTDYAKNNNEIIELKDGKELLKDFLKGLKLEYTYECYRKKFQSLYKKEKLENYLQQEGYVSEDIKHISDLAENDVRTLSLSIK